VSSYRPQLDDRHPGSYHQVTSGLSTVVANNVSGISSDDSEGDPEVMNPVENEKDPEGH